MSPEMSSKWIDLVEANNVTSEDLSGILSKYFRENRDVIWEDALLEHELLND
jgi:hypothetical protein